MVKRKTPNLFSLCAIIVLVWSCSAENDQSNRIIMDGKNLPLFLPFPQIKDSIFLLKDIEYLDRSKHAYYYEGRIFAFDEYKITPQLVFILDTSNNKIVKQSVYYIVEHPLRSGHFTNQSLKELFAILKQKNLPFLEYSPDVTLGSNYSFKFQSWTCKVRITQPIKFGTYSQEISIDIEISQP